MLYAGEDENDRHLVDGDPPEERSEQRGEASWACSLCQTHNDAGVMECSMCHSVATQWRELYEQRRKEAAAEASGDTAATRSSGNSSIHARGSLASNSGSGSFAGSPFGNGGGDSILHQPVEGIRRRHHHPGYKSY